MNDEMKFTFNPEGWDVKTTERSKDRMKFRLKLNQEESEAFKSFSNQVKPEDLTMDDFVRSIFFAGIRSLEEELTQNIVKHMEENREEFEASGFTFDKEGNFTGVDEATASGSLEMIE